MSLALNSTKKPLSFLSIDEHQRYAQLFTQSLVSQNDVALSPEVAKSILLNSNLAPQNLAKVWELSDLNKSGQLTFPELCLALYLCNNLIRTGVLPSALDPGIKREVEAYIDEINFSIPEEASSAAQSQPAPVQPVQPLQPQHTSYGFQNQTVNIQPTGLQFQATGFQPINTQATGLPAGASAANLKPQLTGGQPLKQMSQQQAGLNPQFTGFVQQPNGQATGLPSVGSTGIQQQATGFQSAVGSNGLQQQATGFQSAVGSNGLQQQATGFQSAVGSTGIQQQPTGLVPLQQQRTGANPTTGMLGGAPNGSEVKPQATGLVPLNGQQTGGIVPQPTGGLVPLQGQQTGGLVPLQGQQTGGLVPLQGQQTGGLVPLQGQQTGGLAPQQTGGLVPLQGQQTGALAPQPTGPLIPITQEEGFQLLKAQKTGVGQNSLFLNKFLPPAEASSSSSYESSKLSKEEEELFKKIFEKYDYSRTGLLDSDIVAEIFRKSGINRHDLEKVWDLITKPNQTSLDRETFSIGMWLIYKKINGYEIPNYLPESLKPKSLSIIDEVKKSLKVNGVKSVKKSSHSKLDGTRFKNNDDEMIVSSSRHRRHRKTEGGGANGAHGAKMSIEELKKAIKEKKILLDAALAISEDIKSENKSYEGEDRAEIERLKQEISALPEVSSGHHEELRAKYGAVESKFSGVIAEISRVEASLTSLKTRKICSKIGIYGTGANGEITESDIRKAKSKKLLKTKMAKLTGKPVEQDEDEGKFEQLVEELNELRAEEQKSKANITSIEKSIRELLESIGQSLRATEDKRFELGVDMCAEVREFILRSRVRAVVSPSLGYPGGGSAAPGGGSAAPGGGSAAPGGAFASPGGGSGSPGGALGGAFASPGGAFASPGGALERKAYIREQARKKMQERLAKLGITPSSTGGHTGHHTGHHTTVTAITTAVDNEHSGPAAPPAAAQPPAVAPAQPPAYDDSSSEDEETQRRYEQILAQHRRR